MNYLIAKEKKGAGGKMEGKLQVGDTFIIDTCICEDVDVINWYTDQSNKVLVAEHIEEDVNGVWVKDCPYRIDLSEIVKVNLPNEFKVELLKELEKLAEQNIRGWEATFKLKDLYQIVSKFKDRK